MKGFQRYAKPLLIVCAVAIALLGGTTAAQARRIDALNTRLNANYTRALYECAELMRGVETNLRKLTVSASVAQLQKCLEQISRQAQGAETAVAALPLGGDGAQTATKAINQMGDYAAALSDRLARGGAIGNADVENINQLIDAATVINEGLQRMISDAEEGYDFSKPELLLLSSGIAPGEEASTYPTLIYDGPFSDAAQKTTFKALAGEAEVTAQQAQQRLTAYIGADEARLTGESDIPIPVYEFALRTGNVDMTAAVTRQGGHVLYILPEMQIASAGVSAEQCVSNAAQFLHRNGYGDMQPSYDYRAQNVLTVNFAAVQDGVLLYPDLIKVQVSMQDGSVIGVECANYLKNHVARNLEAPRITAQQALDRLNTELQPESVRLALIPLNTREELTYEISVQDHAGDRYLVYIDAVTGQERQIYQLITDENGTLTE